MSRNETTFRITGLPQTYDALIPLLLPPKTPAPLLQPPSPPSSNRPRPVHPELTAVIAGLQLHPCIETFLHILNTDLASAHFLVRHMQARSMLEGMFLHGILHRIEGDTDNARAWYADVTGSGIFEYVWAQDRNAADQSLEERLEEAKKISQKFKAQQAKEHAKESGGQQNEGIDDSQDSIATTYGHPDPGSDDAKGGSSTLTEAHAFLDRVRTLQKSVNKQRGQPSWESERAELSKLSEREVRRVLTWLEKRFGTEKWEDALSELPRMAGKLKEMASKQLIGGEGYRKF